MDGRIANVLEGLSFALLFLVVFWFIAYGSRKVFGKDIRFKYYYPTAFILGFILDRILIAVFKHSLQG